MRSKVRERVIGSALLPGSEKLCDPHKSGCPISPSKHTHLAALDRVCIHDRNKLPFQKRHLDWKSIDVALVFPAFW